MPFTLTAGPPRSSTAPVGRAGLGSGGRGRPRRSRPSRTRPPSSRWRPWVTSSERPDPNASGGVPGYAAPGRTVRDTVWSGPLRRYPPGRYQLWIRLKLDPPVAGAFARCGSSWPRAAGSWAAGSSGAPRCRPPVATSSCPCLHRPRPAVLEFPCAYRGGVGVWFDRLRIERSRTPGDGPRPPGPSRPLPRGWPDRRSSSALGADAGAPGRGPPARRRVCPLPDAGRLAPALLPALARPGRAARAPRRSSRIPTSSGVNGPRWNLTQTFLPLALPFTLLSGSASTPPTTCSSSSPSRRPVWPPTGSRASSRAIPSPRWSPASVSRCSGATRPLFGGHPAGFALALVPAVLWGLDVALTRRRVVGGVGGGLAFLALAMLEPQYTYLTVGLAVAHVAHPRVARSPRRWSLGAARRVRPARRGRRRLGLHAPPGVRRRLDRRRRTADRRGPPLLPRRGALARAGHVRRPRPRRARARRARGAGTRRATAGSGSSTAGFWWRVSC